MKLYDFFLGFENDNQTEPEIMVREVALGQVLEPYVLYSEAQERIAALEWLVECERIDGNVAYNGPAEIEFMYTLYSARDAAGV